MLEVQHISFSWGRKLLLDDVSFSVAPGETVVLAGENGAGKTTLLKVLAGLCEPSAGQVLADGVDTFRHPLRFRRMMGYLPETAPADPDLRVRDYLRYRANLRGEMAKKIRHRVAEAMDLCGLGEHAGVRIGDLSFGLRKRVALADALLLRPRFLLLDDLLAGLDPVSRLSFGRILAAMSSFASVVVSGHELDELAQWATKFYVLRDGKLVGAKTAAGVRSVLGLAAPAGEGAS
ncbi:MAG: ABC transporter ATP-binding protein [Kiritimatiellae bacterium]|nr:ABC transporter ATP-binding protein [Kiritimatiellia bacterium]